MELYIAEYLVENGFANDIVSALKILKVASDNWYDELINEAKIDWNVGPRAKAERKLSSLGQRMRRAKPEQMVGIANRIKQLKSKISLENEKNPPPPQKKGISGIARGGKPQSTGYEVSSVGTQSDIERRVVNLKTGEDIGSSSPRDTLTGGRYADRRTAGGRGTNRSRTGGTYGTRGSSR